MALYQHMATDPTNGPATGYRAGQITSGIRDPDVQDQIAAQRYAAQLGIQPAMTSEANKMSRFNSIFPLLTGQFSRINSQMATAGGQSGKSPEITVGGVLNPQQIQQQVNAMRAGNDQTGASQMAQQGRDTAGRGFGSRSPLLAALRGQTQANTLAENVGGEREIRLGAAQQNAGHLLGTQQAREGQFASRQREDIERRKPYFSLQNTLLQSLAGLV